MDLKGTCRFYIYHKANLNNLILPTTQNVVRNFYTKDFTETTKHMTPYVIIRTCYNDLLCRIDLWENSYLEGIHAFSIQTFFNTFFTLCG